MAFSFLIIITSIYVHTHTQREGSRESFLEPGRAGPALTRRFPNLQVLPGQPPSLQRVTGTVPIALRTQGLPPLQGSRQHGAQGALTGRSLPTAPPNVHPLHPLVTPGREQTPSVAGYPGWTQELVACLLSGSRELRKADCVPGWIWGLPHYAKGQRRGAVVLKTVLNC